MDNKVKLLNNNQEVLLKALSHLEFSFQKCISIDFNNVTEEELVDLEAFSSRFGRVVDIYIKKLLRSILEILKETRPTFLDAVHFCEKINVINSAMEIDKCRDMRNEIVHEYIEDELLQLYKDMITIKTNLDSNIQTTLSFIKSKITQ